MVIFSKRISFLFLTLLCVASLAAQTPAQVSTAQVSIPRVERPPTLEDFLDMDPNGAMARAMAKVEGFVQKEPKDGAPPSQPTNVFLGYDDKNLYIVWLAFDAEPSKIRARLTRREDFYEDDIVQVWLDTFRDQRRGYAFAVNPYGVQMDRLWSEENGFDSSYDTLWYTKAKINDKGYVVWMALPFRSLRFPPNGVQTWGLMFNRLIPRFNSSDYWPRVTSRVQGQLNQAGSATGLERISPGRNMQFIPYGVFSSSRALDRRDSVNPMFVTDRAHVDGGLDSKFVLKDSFVFDVTLNPDFSQVESDEPQVTANQRFEVFFPEKRPFFQENSNYFRTPIDLYFTRRVIDPQFGLRMTGKAGPYSAGFLLADDQSPGRRVAANDPIADKRAYFGILRLSRDIYKQSQLGIIFADREFMGAFNRVGGIDGRFKLSPTWFAEFQGVASSTKFADGSRLAGPAYQTFLAHESRKVIFNTLYMDNSPGFRTQTGFFRRPDIRRASHFFRYNFRPEKTLLGTGPSLFQVSLWDHKGTRLEHFANANWYFDFKRQTGGGIWIQGGHERLRPDDFAVLAANRDYRTMRRGFWFYTSALSQVSVSTEWGFGNEINFNPASGNQPEVADSNFGFVDVTVRPVQRLSIANRYLFNRLVEPTTRESVFNSHIIRSKWNYQFTRELSVRFIAQYNALLSNPLYFAAERSKNANVDFLVTYLLNPGTAVYVGYNSNLQNLDRQLCTRQLDGTCDPNQPILARTRSSYLNDGRVVFVKVSYLLRY